MNNVTLVGRLCADPEIVKGNDGTPRTIINLAVLRDYKNSDGIYESDFISCILWNGIANAVKDYCHKGDVVGIKGKIRGNNYETENHEKKYSTEVVAEKITFISTAKTREIHKEKELEI